MTSTAFDTAPTGTGPVRLERLERYRGVSRALAATTGTDVLLWRVMFVVLVPFDLLGLVLYVAALVAIPERGQPQSLGQRLLHGPTRAIHGHEVPILVVLGLSVGSLIDDDNGFFALVVLAGFAVLFFSRRQAAGAPVVVTEPPASGAAGISYGTGPAEAYAPVPPAPVPPAARSALPSLTLGVALLVVGVLVLLNATGAAQVTAEVVLASALAVVGAGIVVGAWWGRTGLLGLVAAVLTLALAATTVARPALDAGAGERRWEPTGEASYRLGVGEAVLDLRNLTMGTGVPVITAKVDVGHLVVIVPRDVRAEVDLSADLGSLKVPRLEIGGRSVEHVLRLGPSFSEGPPQVLVDASVRIGEVEVRRG